MPDLPRLPLQGLLKEWNGYYDEDIGGQSHCTVVKEASGLVRFSGRIAYDEVQAAKMPRKAKGGYCAMISLVRVHLRPPTPPGILIHRINCPPPASHPALRASGEEAGGPAQLPGLRAAHQEREGHGDADAEQHIRHLHQQRYVPDRPRDDAGQAVLLPHPLLAHEVRSAGSHPALDRASPNPTQPLFVTASARRAACWSTSA